MQYNMSGEQRPHDLRAAVQSKAELVARIFKVLSWVAVVVGSLLTVLLAWGAQGGQAVGDITAMGGLFVVVMGALYTFGAWLHLTLLHVLSGYVAVRLAQGVTHSELAAH